MSKKQSTQRATKRQTSRKANGATADAKVSLEELQQKLAESRQADAQKCLAELQITLQKYKCGLGWKEIKSPTEITGEYVVFPLQ